MAGRNDIWGTINTLFEIGIEIYRLMEKDGNTKRETKDTSVEQMTDGVLLMSNDKEVLIAVKKEIADKELSEAAIALGIEKGGYLCYGDAATAIPMFELSKTNEGIRDYIVSEESLRATLCGHYREYVKDYNNSASPDEQIENADAPPYMFLQKQIDNVADITRNEVNAFQEEHSQDSVFERSAMDDVLELER